MKNSLASPQETLVQKSKNLELSADESIIGYKGRLSRIQYMPKKHKMGYQSIGVS